MSRNGFGLSICTIRDFVPDFEPAPPGYVGKHRKRSRVALLVSARTVMAYAITLAMTATLMTLILLATHSMEV